MVLTVAIVSASSLLVNLMRSNDSNEKSIQAYYLAVEGLEAVRNIRDTNWLNNEDWLGDGFDLWDAVNFVADEDQEYDLHLRDVAFTAEVPGPRVSTVPANARLNAMKSMRPWGVNEGAVLNQKWHDDSNTESPFKRTIRILPYDCEIGDWCDAILDEDAADYVVVESKVTWGSGTNEKNITLHTVLTNWKGGVL